MNMNKIKITLGKIFSQLKYGQSEIFCNIAEGTHAGNITMIADDLIAAKNLIVTQTSASGIRIANVGDKPMGVCTDSGASGDAVNVTLAGSTSSTVLYVASTNIVAGQSLYTAENGKVSPTPSLGSYKVGVALTNAEANASLEADTQCFGGSAFAIGASGTHTWSKDSATVDTLTVSGMKLGDTILATLQVAGGSVKSVSASAGANTISFTLDVAGVKNTTKIAWIAVKSI